MSAKGSKADIKDSLGRCPLYPQKRTSPCESWMSAMCPILLQKDFWPRSEEHIFQIKREWGILIQESGCLDSIIAHFCPSGRWAATFATVSATSGHTRSSVVRLDYVEPTHVLCADSPKSVCSDERRCLLPKPMNARRCGRPLPPLQQIRRWRTHL
jgi:hypothetical protein